MSNSPWLPSTYDTGFFSGTYGNGDLDQKTLNEIYNDLYEWNYYGGRYYTPSNFSGWEDSFHDGTSFTKESRPSLKQKYMSIIKNVFKTKERNTNRSPPILS